jgi:hypothetical protein
MTEYPQPHGPDLREGLGDADREEDTQEQGREQDLELGQELGQEHGEELREATGTEEAPHEAGEATRTGVPAVDRVLADVERLDQAPLEEHLAAFERAHDDLRSALDADPGEPA